MMNKKQQENCRLLIKALRESDIAQEMHIGILCVIMKESQMMPAVEAGYKRSTNERIRKIFGRKKLAEYFDDDEKLTELRKNTRAFFNLVYRDVAGNKGGEDGYTYRGRGYNQITGRGNYRAYSYPGADLEKNPTLLRNPEVAAKVAIKFYRRQLNKIKNMHCPGVDAAIAIAANVTAGLGKSVYSKSVQRAIGNASDYKDEMTAFYNAN